jgi:NitT/TauT family transport system substrate-binding protein
MSTRRDFLRTSGALAGALALPCFHVRAATTALTVGYTAVPDFGAAFIAKEKGYFEKHGLDVKMQLIGLTSTVPATLVSNSIQIGGTTPTVFLQAVESGLDLVGIAAGSAHQPALSPIGVVAKADGPVKTPADLAGRKLAVPGLNGTLHVMARRWLKHKGVDVAKVSFVEVPLPRMDAVLHGGSVDAVVTAEPFVTKMVEAKIGIALPGFAQDTPEGIATCNFAATRQWATANPEAVKAFRAALAEAVAFAKADQAAARAAIGQYFTVPPPVRAAIPFPALQSTLTEAQMRFWGDEMVEQGMLKSKPDLARLIA